MTSIFQCIKQVLTLSGYLIKIELRVKETLSVLISLSILISVIISFGVKSVFLDPVDTAKLFPALIWLSFVLNAATSLGRNFEYEVEHRVIDGLLVAKVYPESIFMAKNVVNFLVLSVANIFSIAALALMLNVNVLYVAIPLALISMLAILAYSSLATISAAISINSRLKGTLMPIILLPLVFPLFFCAVELTTELMQLPLNSQMGHLKSEFFSNTWFSLLLIMALFYQLIGAFLFRGVIRG